ncbi:MAG: hypothetical protein DRN04_07575, partial [Thermoprotei archaeon]
MGREEFVEIIRTNILRIEVDEKTEELLKCLQREFKKYFDMANKYIGGYYRGKRKFPSAVNVYRILRENGASSTIANEVSKKVLEAWKSYIELEKKGFKTSPPEFRNIPVILHNQQYRVHAVRREGNWVVEKIQVRLSRKWMSIRARGKVKWTPVLESGLVFYINGLRYPIVELRHCLVDNFLILGEYCTNKNKAEIFRRNGKWYFAFSVSLKIPLIEGNGVAAVDIGARNLIALCGVSDSGEAFSMLFKSGTLRAYWLKNEKLARKRQKIASQYFWEAVKHAESNDKEKEKECYMKYRKFLEKAGRFRKKAREVRKKAINQMAKIVAEFLREKGVSTVFIGNSVCYCVSREDLVEEVVSKRTRELLRGFFAPRQIIDSLRRQCEV